MWAGSSKVEAVLLAASVSFLSLAMLNLSRNSDKNKIILFIFIANQGESNIGKILLKTHANFRSFSYINEALNLILNIIIIFFVPALI